MLAYADFIRKLAAQDIIFQAFANSAHNEAAH